MSLCDVCLSPGSCCKRMEFTGAGLENPQSRETAEHKLLELGFPNFIPAAQMPSGRWYFSCVALDVKSGRCTIYEDRPPVCRSYVAGSDPLCIHYWGDDEPR